MAYCYFATKDHLELHIRHMWRIKYGFIYCTLDRSPIMHKYVKRWAENGCKTYGLSACLCQSAA